jgi:hypothetical protein
MIFQNNASVATDEIFDKFTAAIKDKMSFNDLKKNVFRQCVDEENLL